MILYWVAKVLTKASKYKGDIRPGKDACVYVMTTGLAKAATQGYQSQGVFGLIGVSISLRYNG